MIIKGNKVQLQGEDFRNDEINGIFVRILEQKRKETGDPKWGTKGRPEEIKEARDLAVKCYTVKYKASLRIREAEALYGQTPAQLN